MNLTYDEQQVIAIFHSGSRMSTITAIQEIHGKLEPDETELLELTEATVEKLWSMTDAEFDTLDISLDFGE